MLINRRSYYRYLTNTATRNIRQTLIIQGRTKGKKVCLIYAVYLTYESRVEFPCWQGVIQWPAGHQ